MAARWEGFRGLGEKGKRDQVQIASYKNSQGDVKYSTGNTVNSIIISVYGFR